MVNPQNQAWLGLSTTFGLYISDRAWSLISRMQGVHSTYSKSETCDSILILYIVLHDLHAQFKWVVYFSIFSKKLYADLARILNFIFIFILAYRPDFFSQKSVNQQIQKLWPYVFTHSQDSPVFPSSS